MAENAKIDRRRTKKTASVRRKKGKRRRIVFDRQLTVNACPSFFPLFRFSFSHTHFRWSNSDVFLRLMSCGLDNRAAIGENGGRQKARMRSFFSHRRKNRTVSVPPHFDIMPHSDFDVNGLSRYLHLSPQQVTKLAERGKLPGRKVAGAWRFAKPDVHHWFENRIGLSDEIELLEVEAVLQRSSPTPDEDDVCIAEMLPIEAIAVPLAARTRNSVIDSMVELAAQTGWLWDVQEMAAAVKLREDMHSTALDVGVALLHPRRPMAKILAQPFVALGSTAGGIPFGGAGALTDIFFLICSMEDRGHLRTLARLSRILASSGFLDALRQVSSAAEARQLIVETEEKL
jgi:PTS system nitrogen regulatory IIA component